MKVLGVNGSPKGRESNTDCILQPFLKGTRDAGAEAEVIYLYDRKIAHCIGCYSCWSKTPGECIHKDDMRDLLPKVMDADIIVWASPLYFYTVTGIMKNFIDRLFPLLSPAGGNSGNRYNQGSQTERNESKKNVLISTCGFPGKNNFSGLIESFRIMNGGKIEASILFAEGGLLKKDYLKEVLAPYFSAVESAGREIVRLGYVTLETQSKIDKDAVHSLINEHRFDKQYKPV
ncbi:MAG: flavodoxin family protein [Bacillota bacterium]|nr:flavodoxin family protein [Bacillota bacterium]